MNAYLNDSKKILLGIHGLRGIAAIAVALFHLCHIAHIDPPKFFSFIKLEFSYGVYLFFILSAFSLMHSTSPTIKSEFWCRDYFIKRFFRIAPLFYCILIMQIFNLFLAGTPPSFSYILLNLTFTFGGAPWTGIVMAGWTIGVEMIFYLLLPIFLMIIKKESKALMFATLSLIISVASGLILEDHYKNLMGIYNYNWSGFSFLPNIFFFSMGIYAFFVTCRLNSESFIVRFIFPIIILLSSLYLLILGTPILLISFYEKFPTLLWGGIFCAACIKQAITPNCIMKHRYLQFCGERSYSIYLLHPLVLVLGRYAFKDIYTFFHPSLGNSAYFVCAALFLAILLSISEVAYRWIEIPGIQYGKTLIQRLTYSNTKP